MAKIIQVMQVQGILSDLKNRKFAPIYLLQGEESYFTDVVSDYIEEHVLSEAEKGFNQAVLYGKDTQAETLINHARRYPMMGEYQVVLLKEAQGMSWTEEEALLLNYFQNPLSSTILVIAYKQGSMDKRTKVYKALAKNAVVLDSKRLYDHQVAPWIKSYVESQGLKIQTAASALIAEYLGSHLSTVANELDKLIINLPKGTEINTGHVQENIGISKDFNVFELNKALAYKDILKANRIINYFAANPRSNPPPLVFGAMIGYFTRVLRGHYAPSKQKQTLARTIGVPEFFVEEYQVALQQYNRRKVFDIISVIREYDLKSKGVGSVAMSNGALFKEMVYKILH